MTNHYNDDGTINENWLAEQIAELEAGKEEVNIAQIKEILKISLELLAVEDIKCIQETLKKHK